MPMIDIPVVCGTFVGRHCVAQAAVEIATAMEQVPTNTGALDTGGLDRNKWLAAVEQLTRTVPSGWGIAGYANTDEQIIGLTRHQIAPVRQA